MNKEYAAGIVLYNPNISRLKLNIESIYKQVDKVLLFDNGSKNIKDIETLGFEYINLEIIKSSTNIGIAAALNRLVDKASLCGYTWILTLDQDSISDIDMIDRFQDHINFNDLKNKVGIICPKFIDKRRISDNSDLNKFGVEEVEFCITSGSLTNISICKKIGGFDEKLFIGLVDNEYCYRLVKSGYKILLDNDIVLNHELGNITPSKLEKLYLKLGEILHSNSIKKLSYKREVYPMRLYYATRNMIYLNRKYEKNEVTTWSTKSLIKNCVSNVLRGKKKIELIRAIINGVRDGKELR